MRKNLLFLFSCTAFYATTASGQADPALNKFTFRTNRYQAFTADIGGGFNSDNTTLTFNTGESRSGSGSFNTGYSRLISTDKLLQQLNAGLGGGWSGQRSAFNSDVNKNNGHSGSAQFGIRNQFFNGQRFFELGGDAAVQGGRSQSKQTTSLITTDARTENGSYQLSLQLGYGKGRLENITDMQNALWLAKALQQEGRLTRELNTDELILLGRSITRSNNTRILDFRKQRQFQLETVDAYLQEKGLISKNDITYFSNLNDILFFAFNNFRLRGSEKFIRVTPAVSGGRQEFENNNDLQKLTRNIKSATFTTGFNRYQPQRLTRQLNYGVAFKATYLRHEANSSFTSSGLPVSSLDENNDVRQAGITAFVEQAFYPNTRTIASFRLQAESGYQDINTSEKYYGQFLLQSQLNYFISYRTRFTANAGLSYNKNTYQVAQQLQLLPENLRFSISAGLAISL